MQAHWRTVSELSRTQLRDLSSAGRQIFVYANSSAAPLAADFEGKFDEVFESKFGEESKSNWGETESCWESDFVDGQEEEDEGEHEEEKVEEEEREEDKHEDIGFQLVQEQENKLLGKQKRHRKWRELQDTKSASAPLDYLRVPSEAFWKF